MTKKKTGEVTSEMIALALLKRARKERHRLILNPPTPPHFDPKMTLAPAKTTLRAILSGRGGESC